MYSANGRSILRYPVAKRSHRRPCGRTTAEPPLGAVLDKDNDDGPGAVIYAMCSLPAAGVTKTIRAIHSARFGQPVGGDLALATG